MSVCVNIRRVRIGSSRSVRFENQEAEAGRAVHRMWKNKI